MKEEKSAKPNKHYRFVGDGWGVPGLPHEVDDATAKEMGVTELLKEALRNGNYREVKSEDGEQKLPVNKEM